MKTRSLVLALAVFAALACSKEGPQHETTVAIDDIPKEIRIPSSLWEDVQQKNSSAKPAEGEAEGGESAGGSAVELEEEHGGVLFMPIDVILEEKNPGVLKQSPVRFKFPRGGGAIDLSQIVGDQPGSFFVRFELPDIDEPEKTQAWFVSKARRRKLGDEIWGAGCNKYFRITKGLARLDKTGGLKVNTTRDRHVTVLGGHFVFSAKKQSQTFTTQVTFKDPRHPDFYCEDL